jgi:hypothetical protein
VSTAGVRLRATSLGGVTQSGVGREGRRDAIEEMTEMKVMPFTRSGRASVRAEGGSESLKEVNDMRLATMRRGRS